MSIILKLTEWQVMVLRAALENHKSHSKSEKHRMTAQEILDISRAQDNPIGAISKLTKNKS